MITFETKLSRVQKEEYLSNISNSITLEIIVAIAIPFKPVSICLGRYCTSATYIKQINIVQGACGQLLIVDGHIL